MQVKSLASLVLSCTVLFAACAAAQGTPTGKAGGQDARKVQNVRLTFDDKGYVVTPSTVRKGTPVKMEVDLDTVKGCMRTVVISAFDVKKTVKTGDTAVEFTPTKTGDIQIVCGMNMGKGSFKVVEADGK